MTRSLPILVLVLLAGGLIQSFAGTNDTVILSSVAITESLNEGEVATINGNVGDLALSQNDRFFNQLCLLLLGRGINPAELEMFEQSLAQNASRQQIAASLLVSTEYRVRFVQDAYSTYLQRPADAVALSNFSAALAGGSNQEQVLTSIISSDEYFQKRGQNLNEEFLNALYQDLLGRAIDLVALEEHISALNHGLTRAELVRQVLASPECWQRRIEDIFRAWLHRSATPADLSTWTSALTTGTRIETLIATLAGSQEFFNAVPKTAYHLTVDWNDGSIETVELLPPAQQGIFFPFQIVHRYLDNRPKGSIAAPINVALTLRAETGVATAVAQLFVRNVAPQLRNLAIPTPSGIGTVATLTADVVDPGIMDALSLLVDWGEGKGAQTIALPAGTSSFKLTHIYSVGGNLQVNVSLKDDDDAITSQSLSLFVTAFVLPEAIPSTAILQPSDDSGVASNDAITRTTNFLHFSGTARPGNRIEVFANGQLIGFNTAEPSGQWSVMTTSALADGTYQITARATDSGNNVSLPSQPLILVIDTKPPWTPSAPDLLASSDTGASNFDNVTTAAVRSYVGTSEPGALVELLLGTNVVGVANVDMTGQWRVDESRLGPGSYSFLLRVKDRAGNASALSNPLTVTISGSLAPPSAPALLPQSDLGLSSTDLVTSATEPTCVGTSEPNALIQLLANNVVVGSGVADATGHWTITPTGALKDGVYSLTARTTDAAENTSSLSSALAVTIDSTPPAAPTTPGLIASNNVGTSNVEVVASVSSPAFGGRAEAGTLVELLVNGVSSGSALAKDGSWIIPVGTPLGDATYQVSARATDLAGNTSVASPALGVTIKTPAAHLSLTRFQTTFLLSWPNEITGYFLESADALGGPWVPVDKTPAVEGDTKIVILSGGSPIRFYRLKKQ